MQVEVKKDKISVVHLRKVATDLGIDEKTGDDDLPKSVAEELANRHPGANILECSECRFPSPDAKDLTACPGCGDSFEDIEDDGGSDPDDADQEEGEGDVANAAKAKGAKATKAKATKAKGAKATKEKKTNGANGANGAHAVSATPATREKLDGKKEVPRGTPENPEVILPSPVAISPAEAKRRLDEISREIGVRRADLATNGWDIGNLLREVMDRDLWKTGFDSFADYVERTCGFSAQTGRDFTQIARNFKREDIGTLTISSLRLLIKAPEGAREELVNKAREEKPSRRELAEQVRTKREEAGLSTERRGVKGVMVTARLEPGVIFEGAWSKYEGGKGRGRFKIGDQTFVVETNKQHGFKVSLVKPKE